MNGRNTSDRTGRIDVVHDGDGLNDDGLALMQILARWW